MQTITFKLSLIKWTIENPYPETLMEVKPRTTIAEINEAAKGANFTQDDVLKLMRGCEMFGKDKCSYKIISSL